MSEWVTSVASSGDGGKVYFRAALISFLPMCSPFISRYSGWDADIVSLIAVSLTVPFLFRLLPERWSFGRQSWWCVATGVVLGALVFWLRYRHLNHDGRIQSTNGMVGVWVALVLTGWVIPIWEEKACRDILFRGLGQVMPLIGSAIMVSAAFALVHRGNEVVSFVLSLALCWAAYKGINTWDRSLFHGAYNICLVTPQFYLSGLL